MHLVLTIPSSSYVSFNGGDATFLGLLFSSLFVMSHSTVTRVENTSTTSEAQALGPEISKQTRQPSRLETRSCPGIEERLRNVETHLGYGPGTVSLNHIDTGCLGQVKKLWVVVQFWTKSIPMHPCADMCGYYLPKILDSVQNKTIGNVQVSKIWSIQTA